MKDNIYLTFVRYGKLKLSKQLHYNEEYPTFHSPPAKVGFYAMPYKFQELFLIGSIDKTQSIKINTKKGGSVNFKGIRKSFIVSKEDFIWSHLHIIPNNEILERKGSWVKTTVGSYVKYLTKFHSKNRIYFIKYTNGDINSVDNSFSKDSYEVFFDYKVF